MIRVARYCARAKPARCCTTGDRPWELGPLGAWQQNSERKHPCELHQMSTRPESGSAVQLKAWKARSGEFNGIFRQTTYHSGKITLFGRFGSPKETREVEGESLEQNVPFLIFPPALIRDSGDFFGLHVTSSKSGSCLLSSQKHPKTYQAWRPIILRISQCGIVDLMLVWPHQRFQFNEFNVLLNMFRHDEQENNKHIWQIC